MLNHAEQGNPFSVWHISVTCRLYDFFLQNCLYLQNVDINPHHKIVTGTLISSPTFCVCFLFPLSIGVACSPACKECTTSLV
jgi:hypothetical protein